MAEHPLAALSQIDPAIRQHLQDIDGLIYGDGALASAALQAGATKQEIAEALRVAYHLAGVGTLYTASQGLKDLP